MDDQEIVYYIVKNLIVKLHDLEIYSYTLNSHYSPTQDSLTGSIVYPGRQMHK